MTVPPTARRRRLRASRRRGGRADDVRRGAALDVLTLEPAARRLYPARGVLARTARADSRECCGLGRAVGVTAIFLHPLLPLAGVSTRMERERVSKMTVSPMARLGRAAAVNSGGCVRTGLGDAECWRAALAAAWGVARGQPLRSDGEAHEGSERSGGNERVCVHSAWSGSTILFYQVADSSSPMICAHHATPG